MQIINYRLIRHNILWYDCQCKRGVAMKEYLYDMHVHTEESSSCAHVPAKAVVQRYKDLGYDGIVITDHMSEYKMKRAKCESIEEKAEYFLRGYREAKKYEDGNFNVILGMELSFLDYDGDFLVYGIDEDFMLKYHFDRFHSLEDFRQIADENNLFVFQAHPFRFNMAIQNPELLDGMEVYNGHPGHNSNNDIAEIWASKYGLRKSSGSDFHGDKGDMPPGGIYFGSKITNAKELKVALEKGNYRLKTE